MSQGYFYGLAPPANKGIFDDADLTPMDEGRPAPLARKSSLTTTDEDLAFLEDLGAAPASIVKAVSAATPLKRAPTAVTPSSAPRMPVSFSAPPPPSKSYISPPAPVTPAAAASVPLPYGVAASRDTIENMDDDNLNVLGRSDERSTVNEAALEGALRKVIMKDKRDLLNDTMQVFPKEEPVKLPFEYVPGQLHITLGIKQDGRNPNLFFPHQEEAVVKFLSSNYGALLADDMGLGKTRMILGVLKGHYMRSPHDFQALVIVPKALIDSDQWLTESANFFHNDWDVFVYTGSRRQQKLRKAESRAATRPKIILTTISTLWMEMPHKLFPKDVVDQQTAIRQMRGDMDDTYMLAARRWTCIVLDEAHLLKNAMGKAWGSKGGISFSNRKYSVQARALLSLRGRFRYALTGTPVMNRGSDLISIVCWTMNIDRSAPIVRGWLKQTSQNPKKIAALAQMMGPFVKDHMLCRLKSEVATGSLALPPRDISLQMLRLDNRAQNEFYTAVLDMARAAVTKYRNAMTDRAARIAGMHVLVVFTRLRQACNSLELITLHEKMRGGEADLARETKKHRKALLAAGVKTESAGAVKAEHDKLDSDRPAAAAKPERRSGGGADDSESDDEEDGLDDEDPNADAPDDGEDSDDSEAAAAKEKPKKLSHTELKEIVSELDPEKLLRESPKLRALVEHVRAILALPAGRDPANQELGPEKLIICSQWVCFLYLARRVLRHVFGQSLVMSLFAGSFWCTNQMKKDTLRRFNRDDKCRIMLLSLQAGGVGLNLVTGNHMILTDGFWNEAIENQAFDREYRFGQRRACRVVRLQVAGTIDEHLAAMRDRKNLVVSATLAKAEDRSTHVQAYEELCTSHSRKSLQLSLDDICRYIMNAQDPDYRAPEVAPPMDPIHLPVAAVNPLPRQFFYDPEDYKDLQQNEDAPEVDENGYNTDEAEELAQPGAVNNYDEDYETPIVPPTPFARNVPRPAPMADSPPPLAGLYGDEYYEDSEEEADASNSPMELVPPAPVSRAPAPAPVARAPAPVARAPAPVAKPPAPVARAQPPPPPASPPAAASTSTAWPSHVQQQMQQMQEQQRLARLQQEQLVEEQRILQEARDKLNALYAQRGRPTGAPAVPPPQPTTNTAFVPAPPPTVPTKRRAASPEPGDERPAKLPRVSKASPAAPMSPNNSVVPMATTPSPARPPMDKVVKKSRGGAKAVVVAPQEEVFLPLQSNSPPPAPVEKEQLPPPWQRKSKRGNVKKVPFAE